MRADAVDTLRAEADGERATERRLAIRDHGVGDDEGDRMVPVPAAVAGLEREGVMGDDGTVRQNRGAGAGGRAGPAGYSRSGLDLPGETLSAGPYTQERMRQHVLAHRDGDAAIDGRGSTIRGSGVGGGDTVVSESQRTISTLGPRAIPGRQPGATVIAEDTRFAR